MKFTFNWLKEFVAVKIAPEKLAELFTMSGLEVESLTPLTDEAGRPDWAFEIAVTPNRGDCLSLAGLAREVAALTGAELKSLAGRAHAKDPTFAKRASVEIAESRLCRRYSARIVDDIRIGPSPEWIRFRLEASGIRAINNVVDVTNYVMLETGQPLHAFDLERLPAKKIIVRPAQHAMAFTTLDGVERRIESGDLLICAGDTPVALAGIMGGMESEVRESTRSILLESANFDPTAIRRTAKRLGLHSEASHRFERGVDPEGTVAALNRAVYLLAQAAGGRPANGLADRYAQRPKTPTIILREERIEQLLGLRIDAKQAEKIFQRLGLKTRRRADRGRIEVVPPTSRADLTREADLIEELARVHGYDTIPSALPSVSLAGAQTDERLKMERRVRAALAGEGLAEVVNLPFTTEQMNRLFTGLWQDGDAPVAVLNPLAKESAQMRLSLLPGLLENLRYNLAQHAESFWAYHLGKVFRSTPAGAEERQVLAGILHGPRPRRGLRAASDAAPGFLGGKGVVESLLDALRLAEAVTWNAPGGNFLHPGRSATLRRGDTNIGGLGQLHPDVCAALQLPPAWLFELDFEILLEYAPRKITTRSLPRFPSVERDFAVVVDRAFPSRQIVGWLTDLGEALIEQVQVFDQYEGSSIPEGKKSLAYKILYRADDRTLTDAEVNTLHQSLVDRITKLFGAQLRS